MRPFVPILVAALMAITSGVATAGRTARTTNAPAIGGYCPVAYAAMGKAVKGDPKVFAVHDGHRYLFSNADAKKMFMADPDKYRVGYDGWCATAMSMGKQVKSDPALFSVDEGVTFLFSGAEAKKMFDADPDMIIGKADQQWMALKQKRK